MTTLTQIELEALRGIVNSDFRDGNHPVGWPVWSWSANPFPSKRTFSGAMASLSKKGLATSDGGRGDEACVTLTQAGWDALRAADMAFVAATRIID